MALSGVKARERRERQQQKKKMQKPQSTKPQRIWVRDAVVRAFVSLKGRGGQSLRGVLRYLQACCNARPGVYMPSTERVLATMRTVATAQGNTSLWKLTKEKSIQLHSAAWSAGKYKVASLNQDAGRGCSQEQHIAHGNHNPRSCDSTNGHAEVERQFSRLKEFLLCSERADTRHKGPFTSAILARTLHGPIEVELIFASTENEMRGKMTIILGAFAGTQVTGAVTAAGSGQLTITGLLNANGSASLRLGNLELYTNNLASAGYACIHRGGCYVDLIGSDISNKKSFVRAYCMLSALTSC